MTIRKRLHQITFEAATITRIVCLTLVIMHENWLHDPKTLVGFVMSSLSAIFMLICFVMFIIRRIRNNIAPLVFIIFIGITGLLGIVESILYGLAAFGVGAPGSHNKKQEILVSAMAYSITSLLFSLLLLLMLIFWPPEYDPSRESEKNSIKENSVSKKESAQNPPKSQRSQKSRRSDRSKRKSISARKGSKRSERSIRKL